MKAILTTCLIAGMIVVGAYIAHDLGYLPDFMSKRAEPNYIKVPAPANPNLTEDQKFVFENRLRSSSTLEEKKEILGKALRGAVDTDRLILGENCTPDSPIIKAYPFREIFVTSVTSQTLVIFGNNFALEPNVERGIMLTEIDPRFSNPVDAALLSYSCTGSRGTAGFIVILPD